MHVDLTALRRRIAEHLDWSPEEVGSFSLATLRDVVTSETLRHEIDVIVRGGLHVVVDEPASSIGVRA